MQEVITQNVVVEATIKEEQTYIGINEMKVGFKPFNTYANNV